MGNRAEPIIAFGFEIGAEEEVEIEGFADLVEATDNLEDDSWPVVLVSHGHHEYRYWFLSVRGTHQSSGDWGGTVDVPSLEPEPEKIQAAKAWCKEHNIPWKTPAWSAMASYG